MTLPNKEKQVHQLKTADQELEVIKDVQAQMVRKEQLAPKVLKAQLASKVRLVSQVQMELMAGLVRTAKKV